MSRTTMRPVPAGRMPPLPALALGIVLSVFGVAYLAIVCNALSAALTAITVAIYIFADTHVQRDTTVHSGWGTVTVGVTQLCGSAGSRESVCGVIVQGAACDCEVHLWQIYRH